MNEKKKMILVVAIFVAVVIFIGLTAYVGSKEEKKQLEEFYKYFDSSEEKLIYFAREGCSYGEIMEPAREELLESNEIDYYNIDTMAIDENLLDKILSKLDIGNNFGTPTMVIVKDGKVLNVQSGIFTLEESDEKTIEENNKEEFKKYLEEYNILEKSE